jgi:hypothetical protein
LKLRFEEALVIFGSFCLVFCSAEIFTEDSEGCEDNEGRPNQNPDLRFLCCRSACRLPLHYATKSLSKDIVATALWAVRQAVAFQTKQTAHRAVATAATILFKPL